MIVKVTQKHIKKGKCWETTKCALALAVLDAIPTAVRVSICSSIVVTHKDKTESTFDLTKRANKFIDAFDNKKFDKKEVKPTTFLFKQIHTV